MPFTNNQGVRIHYETAGSGPALVLHHGTFLSGKSWVELGYVDALKEDHQLILLDARGHGDSDKPYDTDAYDVGLRALDVLAVLDDLSIRKADYLGYSLGGWIGFELARLAPHRFNSFIFGSAHPYAESMQAFRDIMSRGFEVFATMIDQGFGSSLTPALRSQLLANDLDALRTLTQDRVSNAGVLQSMRMPCLFFVGELDPRLTKVKDCVDEMPRATFLTLSECDHAAGLMRSDLVIPHIKAFLSNVGL